MPALQHTTPAVETAQESPSTATPSGQYLPGLNKALHWPSKARISTPTAQLCDGSPVQGRLSIAGSIGELNSHLGSFAMSIHVTDTFARTALFLNHDASLGTALLRIYH